MNVAAIRSSLMLSKISDHPVRRDLEAEDEDHKDNGNDMKIDFDDAKQKKEYTQVVLDAINSVLFTSHRVDFNRAIYPSSSYPLTKHPLLVCSDCYIFSILKFCCWYIALVILIYQWLFINLI